MAAERRRRRPVQKAEYIMGYTARRLEFSEQPIDRERPKQQRRVKHHTVTVRRNREKALHMNLPYVCALTVAAVCALYLCAGYLRLQSSVAARQKNVESMERMLDDLREENDALETRINTSVDLDYIYKVATEELGMVYADESQVRLYNKTESEYVRQYEDIPER